MNIIINNLKLRKQDSMILIVMGILVCILVAFFKESIFPEKYFFDSYTIQRLVERPYKDIGDKSFTNTADFFRILHIDKFVLAPIIALVSYISAIIFLFKRYNLEIISFQKFLLIVVYSAMAMVYISTYSKDLILFLVVIVPFVFFEKKALLVWTLFVILYATFFRQYWFIILALFWGLKYFIVKKPKLLLLAIPVYYVLISFIYNYIFGTSLSMIRYLTNLDRDAESAQTAIKIFIPGSNFLLEAANFFVTLLLLIAPIPLVLLGKPFYIILALLIIVFFYNFIRLYAVKFASKELTNIFSFVISFMLVQSLFEPDYGSFVRHLAPLYPLIFVCIAKNTKFSKEEESEESDPIEEM